MVLTQGVRSVSEGSWGPEHLQSATAESFFLTGDSTSRQALWYASSRMLSAFPSSLRLCIVDDIQQFHIPSDESLEQGRNRSRELLFYMEQPR